MISRLYGKAEAVANGIDTTLHRSRLPLTTLISKLFVKLHMNDRHVTAVRFVLVLAFLLFWMQEQYRIAALLLALNIVLDMVDGDFARLSNADSGLRSFVDVTVDNTEVVVYSLALIVKGLVSGVLGAYYVFVLTASWWLSATRRRHVLKWNRLQASAFLFFTRFFVLIVLIFLYALFRVDVFEPAVIVVSIVLTLNAGYDFFRIPESWPT